MARQSKKSVCVIGLDGLPYSLVRQFIQDGTMPVLAQLTGRGHLHRMKVSLPEVSCVSWTSFMTGTGPGRHGIFGFIDLAAGSKALRFPCFRDVRVPTLWDRLGAQGKRSVVINQPFTYPARPIAGALVSGFVAIELRRAVEPPGLLAELKRLGYELDIDTERARGDFAYLLEALDSTLRGRREAFHLLWEREAWDYFQLVVTGTDRLQHYLWRAIQDKNHPYHLAVREYYRKVDALVGEVVERYEKKAGKEQGLAGLFLLSDHGFTEAKKEFNLNAWLRQEGYQDPAGRAAASPEELAPSSRAFALAPNRIYFNRKDRFADGSVEAREAENLAGEIAEKLSALRCAGERVVERVWPRGELYAGEAAAHGPDLIVLTRYGYDAKSALDKVEVWSEPALQGMHTWDDAFLWTAEKAGEEPHIEDVASLLEAALA